jgi:hypothetical protein
VVSGEGGVGFESSAPHAIGHREGTRDLLKVRALQFLHHSRTVDGACFLQCFASGIHLGERAVFVGASSRGSTNLRECDAEQTNRSTDAQHGSQEVTAARVTNRRWPRDDRVCGKQAAFPFERHSLATG